MSLQEKEIKIAELESKMALLKEDPELVNDLEIKTIAQTIEKYKLTSYLDKTAYDHVYLARKADRPHIHDYIDHLFDDFIEMHGDRYFKDDGAIVGGIAYYRHQPVTIIGHAKGRSLEENMKTNFGMASPEGYRKSLRLMKQAEKFHRPIITFIDTPGAYPGIEAEENGIGEAIGRNLMELSALKVPVLVFVVGEGGSGGALAISIGDHIAMLENAVYSVLSPEGFASILWKDVKGERVGEACEVMKLTAQDLLEAHFIDEIIEEPITGAHVNDATVYKGIRHVLDDQLPHLMALSDKELVSKRYERYRLMGEVGHG